MDIYVCQHCGAQKKSATKILYCSDCNTAEKRKAMDEENKKHFSENGLVYNPPK